MTPTGLMTLSKRAILCHSPTGMLSAGPSANGGKGSHSQPSKVEGPESIAPSMREGSEVDQYDVDDLQLGNVPSGSSAGEIFDVLACLLAVY